MSISIEQLTSIANMTRGPENLRLSLVGNTGAGKTARVYEIAKNLGFDNDDVEVLLLSHMMPEMLGGIPNHSTDGTHYVMSAPEWAYRFTDKPGLIFMDEFDKAREDTTGAALTLLWELRVGNINLHPDTVIITAMQPSDPEMFLSTETGKALSARMIFTGIGYDWNYLSDKYGMDLSFFPTPDDVMLPILHQPSPRQVDMVIKMLSSIDIVDDEGEVNDLAKSITYGVLSNEFGTMLLDHLINDASVGSVKEHGLIESLMNESISPFDLTVPELLNIAPEVTRIGDPWLVNLMMIKIEIEGTNEDIELYGKNVEEYINNTPIEKRFYMGEKSDDNVVGNVSLFKCNIVKTINKSDERFKDLKITMNDVDLIKSILKYVEDESYRTNKFVEDSLQQVVAKVK